VLEEHWQSYYIETTSGKEKKKYRYYAKKLKTKLHTDRSIKEHFRIMEGEYDGTN